MQKQIPYLPVFRTCVSAQYFNYYLSEKIENIIKKVLTNNDLTREYMLLVFDCSALTQKAFTLLNHVVLLHIKDESFSGVEMYI